MLLVQKGNKQLDIDEIQKGIYLALGFSVVDSETGDIKEAGQATTLNDLKAENTTLKTKLSEYQENASKLDQFEEIQKENEDLKAQVADLAAQLETANKGKAK